jgi:hypothetical protein
MEGHAGTLLMRASGGDRGDSARVAVPTNDAEHRQVMDSHFRRRPISSAKAD